MARSRFARVALGLLTRAFVCAAVVVAGLRDAPAAESDAADAFEEGGQAVATTALDAPVLGLLARRNIPPARLATDEVFLRRVYLDMIGTLPEPEETLRFLADRRADKRSALIDALFERDEFADYWALRWCDVLRVKAEFPINLWPNAVQAYHHWIRTAIRDNVPYDRFARELLTSSGSNFRVPQVNFYRAINGRDPAAIAGAVALTFMGSRIESWPEVRRTGLATVFSRVAFKKTAEWKEEIVLNDPAPSATTGAVLPDGTPLEIGPDEDPRRAFADWLVRPENPWFARAVVNRIWFWLMGRGIVHEPDDLRADNPPSNPELLAYLERQLVLGRWDLRRVIRVIVTSRTYQQSPIPRTAAPDAAALFACYPVRRLDAEVLIDALCWIGGAGETYSSTIPEPFTFIPEDHRTIELADGSITSRFLETFGRPARDTGLLSERNNAPTDAQRLFFLNSSDVQRRVERSRRLRVLRDRAKNDRSEVIRLLYVTLLSRPPQASEAAAAEQYFKTAGLTPKQAADDLAWALINTKEFLYRH